MISRIWFFISIWVLCSLGCKGQMIEQQSSVDSVIAKVVIFLVAKGELENGKSAQEYSKRMNITELLQETALGYSKTGIYRIRVFTSHTKQYLLIRNDAQNEILDTDSLGETLRKAVYFFLIEKLPNDKISAYADKILKMYNENEDRNAAKLKGKRP